MIQINEKVSYIHGLGELILLKYPYVKVIYRFSAVSTHQNTNNILYRLRKNNLKVYKISFSRLPPPKNNNNKNSCKKHCFRWSLYKTSSH